MTKCLCLASLVFAVGCAVDDGSAPETGETQQAVTGTALNSWTCTYTASTQYNGEVPCNFDLGPGANTACALAGIAGPAAAGTGTGVYINNNPNGENTLTVYASSAGTVTVWTVCTSGVSNITTGPEWHSSFGPNPIQVTNPGSSLRCFLTEYGIGGGGGSYTDSARVWQDNKGTWWIGGAATDYVSGTPVCFSTGWDGDWGWGQTSGNVTGNLQSNAGGGVACALTELGGVFSSWSDGMWISFNPQTNTWQWNFEGAKHAAAECFR
jgi:hypothetical protein